MNSMKLQPINLSLERPDVILAKHRYGIWFGLFLGLGFAIFTWGIDSYVLSIHHGLQPWLKFIIGGVICMITGGIAGWLSAKANKPLYSVLIWLVASSVFAWLIVNLPLLILPKALSIFEPQASGLLHYTYYDDFGRRVLVAYVWLGIFIAIAGLLQLPLSDSAVFSTSIFGKLGPILISIVLMAIAGVIVDNGLINQPLRDATVAIDNTIQFITDNRGKEVDLADARRMHTGAFRSIDDSVTSAYKLIVSGYDSQLGEVNILVKFEKDWAECQVFYNQPISCKVPDISP
jgi:hypothetical protein